MLDPFAGTFTTCAVAKSLNRKSIGIELIEEYVKIGLRRIEVASEYNGKILEREKRSFEKLNNKEPKIQSLFNDQKWNTNLPM